jgi:serine/threonine protein kinase
MSLDYAQVVEALPGYDVGNELGRGGWGVVLGGRHRQLGRDVAIKQLPSAFAADESIRARFVVEARVLAQLDHPHIVPVYDFVEADGLCLLVMELLPEGTLWNKFTTDGFTAPAAVAAVLACLAGIQAAHNRNVLHRDVKPDNLMFSASGTLKVTDFGIAKVLGGEETLATQAGQVLGTPAYIAPEQARGGLLSPATDIYAVATMLYELLSGQLPFPDDGDAMALLFKHAYEPPEPLTNKAPEVPQSIAAAVMSGLATEPDERPASAEEFGVALASACTAAWGPGWLPTGGTSVMGASSILAATERVLVPSTSSKVTVSRAAAVGPTIPALVPTSVTAIKPSVAIHEGSAVLAHVSEPASELVPLNVLVNPPKGPAWFVLAAGIFALLSLVLALLGLGAPSRGGTLARGSVSVAGTDATTGSPVTLDMSQPIPVLILPSAASADHVELSASVLGQQISVASAALEPQGNTKVAALSLGGRNLVGGSFTGTVTLFRSGQQVGTWSFAAYNKQIGLLSLPAAVTVLLFFFIIRRVESRLRLIRRGRRPIGAPVGLAIEGALFGVDLVGFVWILDKIEPTSASLIACAVAGSAAGLATALSAITIARRRRFREIQTGGNAGVGTVATY